jgi:beta-lactamase class A
MKSGFRYNLLFLLLLAVLIPAMAGSAAAESRYYVSYVWAHNLDRIQEYRSKLSRILGPEIAEQVKVVAKGNMYGVIYFGSGSSAEASRAARDHSRQLREAGLQDAAPVREGRWSILDGKGATEEGVKIGPPAARTRPARLPETRRDREVRNIETAVERYIKELRRKGKLASDERTAWSVYDFTTGEKLVTINEDVRLQAASLIKPFIAAAFFHKVKSGDFIYGRKSRRHMQRMIQRSDNRSTNWVMRQIGGPAAVQRILRQQYPAIFQDTQVVEYIPAGGKTYRNKASAHDYSRFLYALWNGNIAGAKEIRRLMGLPGSNRILNGADDIPEGTKVFNKTGSTARLCGDMGILIVKGPDGKSYPYTIIGVIEKRNKARNYTAWIRSRGAIIRNVSNIVYKGLARYHDFEQVVVGSVQ